MKTRSRKDYPRLRQGSTNMASPAGVVHKHIATAKLLKDGGDSRLDFYFLGYVQAERFGSKLRQVVSTAIRRRAKITGGMSLCLAFV